METSPEIGELAAALAKAQGALAAPSKNREVTVTLRENKGKYKFKYATLDHLIEHIRPAFTANGIWFIQRTEPGQMVTRIIHSSGQWLDSAVPMPNLPNAPQEAGSILTYFRRYSLAVAAGLASDEDDDANVAEGNGYEPRATNRAKPQVEAPRVEYDQYPFPEGIAKNITALKTMSRALWTEINNCNDDSELNSVLGKEDSRAIIKQLASLENPAHREIWEGDGKDNPGIAGLITRKETEFAQRVLDIARA